MKTILIVMAWVSSSLVSAAQSHDEIITKRAIEFHKVLTVKDKDLWRQFMKDNYTKALLDRPMRARIAQEGGTNSTPAENEKVDPIESKLAMFERLNADFGGSTILSVRPSGNDVEMVVTSEGMAGTFKLTFSKETPYLIDGLGIEVGDR